MRSPDEYRKYAQECERIAREGPEENRGDLQENAAIFLRAFPRYPLALLCILPIFIRAPHDTSPRLLLKAVANPQASPKFPPGAARIPNRNQLPNVALTSLL